MKKNKKSKLVLFSVIGLAAISIGTVGFATWMVGVQKKEETLTVNALVDNTVNSSIYLEANITNKDIIVAEKKEYVKGGEGSRATDIVFASKNSGAEFSVNEHALEFTFSTLQFSKGDTVDFPTQLKLELLESDNNKLSTVDNKVGRTGEASWTYLQLSQTIVLTGESYTLDSSVTNKSYKTYILNETTYSFEWGSFFGNNSPVKYYNDLAATGNKSVDDLFKLSDNVYTEINNMNTKLTGDLTVKVSIN